MVNASPSTHRPRVAAILIVPVVVAVVLTLFAWPTAKVGPRDLPVGARAAIEDREVYGALVAPPSGPKLLIATAGSPAVAQMLTHAASEAGDEVLIEDVVVSTPAGGAVATSVLPLVIAGLLTGALAAALGSPALRAPRRHGGDAAAQHRVLRWRGRGPGTSRCWRCGPWRG